MASKGPTALRRASKRRARLAAYARVCRAIDKRDGLYCRVCRLPLIGPSHHHHIVNRSLGGKDETSNLIRVHVECHGDIHAKRVTVTGNADGELQITWRAA